MNIFQRLKFRFFPPKTIPIIINGGDLAEAGWVCDPQTCLMGTALRRRGYPNDHTLYSGYIIHGHEYIFDLTPILAAERNGIYDPSILGAKFELTLCK